jgi:TonB family protein
MLDEKNGNAGTGRLLPGVVSPQAGRQQRLMIIALALLLISLAMVLYRDRDFWFPSAEETNAQQALPAAEVTEPAAVRVAHASTAKKKTRPHIAAPQNSQTSDDPPAQPLTITRTVLPPLEVEVVAGDSHQTLRPGTNAVRVDLQRPAAIREAVPVGNDPIEPSTLTTGASEKAHISSDVAATIVTQSVQPEYPLLARQMKVQGSVVLQALIGRDGLIEDLRVLSGPPILANAAREAVRQWHFKPHLEGTQAVETRANITVNFTISTN